jgi:hypothetical protein
MAIRKLTKEQLERLAILAALPPDAVLLTLDAALYSGKGGSTWERERAAGKLPAAIHVTSRTLGYRKRALDAHLEAHTEQIDEAVAPRRTPAALPVRPLSGPLVGRGRHQGGGKVAAADRGYPDRPRTGRPSDSDPPGRTKEVIGASNALAGE